MNISGCVYKAHMSHAPSGSLVLQCIKLGVALEIHDAIIFDFFSELPHVINKEKVTNLSSKKQLAKLVTQGWRSRSGRPGGRSGDCRTNVYTEIASPIICLQARNLRIVCELQRPKNKQILSAMATHSQPALLGIR